MESQQIQTADVKDVQDNKVMAILAYLGILVLVPIFAAKESKFARFHANQGVVLLICEIAFGIVYFIVSLLAAILIAAGLGMIGTILIGVVGLCYFVFLILAILGIINAAKGEMKELPFIGKYRILK